MHVFCDESGNTGVDLFNRDQPVFALASNCLDSEAATGLIAPLLRQGQREVKYSKLKGTASGQRLLIDFFSSDIWSGAAGKFMVADKKYYLISHLVDKLIEPTLDEAGIDLYQKDAHVGLVNVWYFAGPTIFPNGGWGRVLKGFLGAIRLRNGAAYNNFDTELTKAAAQTPVDSRDFATGLLLSRGRLEEFIGVYQGLEVFDPAVDLFTGLMNEWMRTYSGNFAVTHDRSKPLKRNEAYLNTLMTPVSPRVMGYGERKAELPLRISILRFGDSIDIPQLQVSDLIAGAAVDLTHAHIGFRPATAYHHALQASKLLDLCAGGMFPSTTIDPVAPPSPDEISLVDGTAHFLRDVGYFPRT